MAKFTTDKTQDEIIFRDDIDEIHEGVKCEPLAQAQAEETRGTRPTGALLKKDAGKPRQVTRETATEAWLANRFEQLLKLDLIDLDDDFYDDKLFYENPKALDKKFEQLEEDNLFYIHRIQDIEQYLETTREQIEVTHKTLDAKIAALQENKSNLALKIDEAVANLEISKKSSFGAQIVDKDSVLRP